jgi:hypothetical protein
VVAESALQGRFQFSPDEADVRTAVLEFLADAHRGVSSAVIEDRPGSFEDEHDMIKVASGRFTPAEASGLAFFDGNSARCRSAMEETARIMKASRRTWSNALRGEVNLARRARERLIEPLARRTEEAAAALEQKEVCDAIREIRMRVAADARQDAMWKRESESSGRDSDGF